ncbi:MAG: GNAT family N-acetyltransferase [Candidatus Helarchaeota archaeon]
MTYIKFKELDNSLIIDYFTSGNDNVDKFLKELARKNLKDKFSKIYVFFKLEDLKVIGYFTLNASQCNLGDAKIFGKNNIPATILGQLGVDINYRGKKLGEKLIKLALEKAYQASKIVGSRLLLVETNPINTKYYLEKVRLGFEFLKHKKKHNQDILFIDLKKYEQIKNES